MQQGKGVYLVRIFFSSCYLDDLLAKLRHLRIGCHVAGVWVGATAYADDLVLLATDRMSLQRMVKICEDYGREYNLTFSTDPNPTKSKSKCVYFSRPMRRVVYPSPILLEGKELPWVAKVDHLGHVLQEYLSMDADATRARLSFMSRASDIRDDLYFAHPAQKVQGIQLYCCDAYGSMMWDFRSKYVESFFKSWNIQLRLAWSVPRETHTHVVEGLLSGDFQSLRSQVLCRYQRYLTKLSLSSSKEVRFIFSLMKKDKRSVTGRNIEFISGLCNVNMCKIAKWKMKELLAKKIVCGDCQNNLLSTLLEARFMRSYQSLKIDRRQLEEMISCLCTT